MNRFADVSRRKRGLYGLVRGLAGVMALLCACLPAPGLAAHWQELGNSSTSLDKIYLDTDSIRQLGGYRIALVMTVYVAPRINKNNIKLDRHIQKDAFDCNNKLFYGIQTTGYLDGKQVGSSAEELD